MLSNSCDVSSENKNDIPVNITFSPKIPLNGYRKLLEQSGIDPEMIEQKISAITEQKVNNLFFLPAGSNLEQDYIALFGDIHSMPANDFGEEQNKIKLFTLSQFGFYLAHSTVKCNRRVKRPSGKLRLGFGSRVSCGGGS